MATITDVALAAGVSRATVSYVLSGKRTISEPVCQRVREAVESLGYTPNAGARALATSQTKVLALMARFLSDEFAPAMLEFIRAVTDGARDLGYDTLLVSDEDGVAALRRLAASRMVDGIVLLNVGENDDRLRVLAEIDQPSVLIGSPGDPAGLMVFDLDFRSTGRLMVRHLHAFGHRELVLVSQPRHVVDRGGAYVWRLAAGAKEMADRLGVTLHRHHAAASQPDVGRQLHDIFDMHPDATGILLNNEAAAAALPFVLRERGLRAPDDVSVIGRYSDDFARAFSLPFTAIDSAAGELGRRAVAQLVGAIEDGAPRDAHLLLPPVVIDRGSVAQPPQP
ncbi:LacI family DNA-binding transcriptional regulator [Microbacterium sp. NE2HP2]|uniref:LacI family DNA-binding transcriptional regulator n=1 Tax=Microbacterium plantarum TaxID=1816425 RepID=UPI002366B18E|nr:LacI family DNA-binding transcriptional regulator [Microbacterium plantarum]MDD7945805.1 LacI family DNA-binding transcriptional regulator [Microbacterium plantarum]